MAIAPEQATKDVMTDFLASGPSIDDIIAYGLLGSLQELAQYLLDKDRGEGLIPAEQQEMDEFLQIDHLMALVKAKARLKRLGRAPVIAVSTTVLVRVGALLTSPWITSLRKNMGAQLRFTTCA